MLEHLHIFFKCFINDTQCVICKRYIRGDRGLNHYLIRSKCPIKMFDQKQDPNAVPPNNCFPNRGGNPVSQTSPDTHESTISRNGKQEERY